MPTAIVSRPRPSMASRAFTAMLMMAVSNWPASALTKHGSSGPRMTISIARTDQGADHFAQRLHASPDVEHFRLQRLPPREGQQLPGQLGGAGHRIRDRLDIAQPPRLRQVGPPQQVDRSADHREQIVEVVRDAAGELAQRLQPLAVLQRFLGLLPLLGFDIKMPGPPQGQPQQGKQQRGGRRAEDQMLAHGGQPARADRRGLEAGADIDRVFGEPPVAEAALDAVGRRRHGDEAGRWGWPRSIVRSARCGRDGCRGRRRGNAPARCRRSGRARSSCRARGRSGRSNSRNIPGTRKPAARRRSCRPRSGAAG